MPSWIKPFFDLQIWLFNIVFALVFAAIGSALLKYFFPDFPLYIFFVFLAFMTIVWVINDVREGLRSRPPESHPSLVSELIDGTPVSRLTFYSPRLGFTSTFATNADVVAWLEDGAKKWKALADASAISTIFAEHAHSNRLILEHVANDVLRLSYSSLKCFERACEREQLLPNGGPLSIILFDNAAPLQDRLFVTSAFVDAKGLDPELGTSTNIRARQVLSDEFNNQFPEFRTTGQEARVLYALSSSSLSLQLEASLELQRKTRMLDDYLSAVRVVAQLGPAASRWRQKSRWHLVGAVVGIAPFIAILFLPLFFAPQLGYVLTKMWALDAQTAEHLKAWVGVLKEAPILSTAFIVIPALLAAWILRHFSRLFIHNLSLASEASNRAAMADVYARMTAQTGGLAPEQQLVIIKRLFGSDEAKSEIETIPATFAEQIAQLFKAKG